MFAYRLRMRRSGAPLGDAEEGRLGRSTGWLAALVLIAGCGRLGFDGQGARTWSFVDEDQAGFDLGRYDAGSVTLAWSGGEVQLAGSPPFDRASHGMYISRPFDTGDDTAIWETLAWVPDAPLGRPLPAAGGGDVGYVEAAVSMADNILLLNLDGEGDVAHDEVVADRSGRNHDGRIVLAGQSARHIAGAFGQALDLDRDAWVTLDGNFFDFGTGDFTYSVWLKNFDCAASNDNRIAMGGAGAGDAPHMWIGALCPDPCGANRDGAFMNFLDSSRNGPSLSPCTGVALEDGQWHHLAGVKRGHAAPAAVVTLYVDGREVATTGHDFGASTLTYNAGEIRLGGFNLGGTTYNTRIVVDEAAIWKRALAPDEVEALYRRGAVHLELQIRICADGTCDDEPFRGPDGTAQTSFTEADLAGATGDQRANLVALGLVGPVAQYRARFSTEFATVSPGLRRVTLEARRGAVSP